MRAPHARRLRELSLEETMLLRLVLRRRRDFAVARIVEHVAELRGDVLLHGEQIADAALLTRFRIRESERALPRFVGHVQLVQRMDERVAAGERNGDEIGLQLHLARQRALRQHDDAEHRLHQRADRPHDEREQPADPGDTQVEARQAAQERIERIALRDDVTGNLLGDVDPAADRHRTLTEVTELVREDRLQLAERDGVDETETDLQVLARREQKIEHAQVVEDGRIHARRQEHAMRARRTRFICQSIDEVEQPRLLRRSDLDVVDRVPMFDEHQRLPHEHREERRADAGDERPQRIAAVRQAREQAIGRPREPARQREVQQHEQGEARHGEPGMRAIGPRGPREIRRHRARTGRIDMFRCHLVVPAENREESYACRPRPRTPQGAPAGLSVRPVSVAEGVTRATR